ncbi:MAG: hypothetical protein PVH40_03920 [Gemmatimonadales bacterium]|jgi:mannose/fructose-specific phosphotransferase system component IIA
MSEPLKGVVICHADLAAALVEAVERIAGDSGGLIPLSNRGASTEGLCADVASAVGEGPSVVFVDMPGSSCLHASLMELRARNDVAVVTGVSLPMLLDFVFHRELSPAAAAKRAVDAGSRSISAVSP